MKKIILLLTKLPRLLFGLFFIGIAVSMYLETGFQMLTTWYEMQSWQPAYAQINRSSGSENYNKAAYSYEINGLSYEGTRVYIADFNDNIGSYHHDMQNRLSHHQRSGKAIKIWVDPDNPHNAVIDRGIRWGLFALITVFCSVFIIFGLAVAVGVIFTRAKKPIFVPPSTADLREEWESKKAQSEISYNDSFISYRRSRLHELKKATEKKTKGIDGELDWKNKKGWEHSQIRSEAKNHTWAMWGFTVFGTPLAC